MHLRLDSIRTGGRGVAVRGSGGGEGKFGDEVAKKARMQRLLTGRIPSARPVVKSSVFTYY